MVSFEELFHSADFFFAGKYSLFVNSCMSDQDNQIIYSKYQNFTADDIPNHINNYKCSNHDCIFMSGQFISFHVHLAKQHIKVTLSGICLSHSHMFVIVLL